MIRFFLKLIGFFFSWGVLAFLAGLGTIVMVFEHFNKDLPDTRQLATYEPATVSRVFSGEGTVLDEFATQKRIYTPTAQIPDLVKQAFISAEDKNFYNHAGYDVGGMVAAARDAVVSQDARGASTITQQVAKNFLLTGEQTVERKMKELLIASDLERNLSKDQILGLYLNEIFLGENSYGVTAAARTYFGKPLETLSPSEVAYLAAIPKAPSTYHPVDDYDRAVGRRNYVLNEMAQNGYISREDADAAIAGPLQTVQSKDLESYRVALPDRDYFTDEIRRQLTEEYGREALFTGGLSVRATIDNDLQDVAAAALREALENYDRSIGIYHGPVARILPETLENWQQALEDTRAPRDVTGWYPAVVLGVDANAARVGVEGHGEGTLTLDDIAWARPRNEDGSLGPRPDSADDMYSVGDVVLVKQNGDAWTLRQIPEVQGAFAAMDPRSGRVLAMQGGFSYQQSSFNRATQAMRQPGSTIKPFIYAGALDNDYSPMSIVVDAPIEIDTPQGIWRPENSGGGFLGNVPLRTGLEQSRNLMTIRLAQDVGMGPITESIEGYGIYDDMLPVLANSLGSQETTLYRMLAAYSLFANGGREVEPTLVDRVQDRYGKTIFKHDARICEDCNGPRASADTIPNVFSVSQQVMDPITAFQVDSMLQGVVSRGTGASTVGKLGLPIAGKTGTTNDAKDVWFIGYTPKIVAGCYLGFDDPKTLGRSAYGGTLCGPVFMRFIQEALKKHGGFERPEPTGGQWVNFNRRTGERLASNASGNDVIREYIRLSQFKSLPAVGGGVKVIDGGFAVKLGSDLRSGNGGAKKPRSTTATVGGQEKAVPTKPSFGSLSSGGLY